MATPAPPTVPATPQTTPGPRPASVRAVGAPESRTRRMGNGSTLPGSRPVGAVFRVFRWVHLFLVGLILLGVLAQAYFAGRYVFGLGDIGPHAALGWPLSHALVPLMFLVSFMTKGGKAVYLGSAVAFVLAAVLPVLAVLNEEGASELEALHPLVAMLLLGALLWLFARTWRVIRGTTLAA